MSISLCEFWSLLTFLIVKILRFTLGLNQLERRGIPAEQRLFRILTDVESPGTLMACWGRGSFFSVLSPSLRAPCVRRLENRLWGMRSAECRVALPCEPLSFDVSIEYVEHFFVTGGFVSRHDDVSHLADDVLEIVEVWMKDSIKECSKFDVRIAAHDLVLGGAVSCEPGLHWSVV
ncbi:hypothetical protein K523DRAFT_243714 [Schizophyllum commune Tattone D]|nr:hypothetical protein K523DRAFT_243714 [Schizophyllum commune Tattone D]